MSVLDSFLERLSINSLLNEEQISRCTIVLQLIDQLLSKDPVCDLDVAHFSFLMISLNYSPK
jgi:hypothetical protein